MQRQYSLVDRLSNWEIVGEEPTFTINGASTRLSRARIYTAPLYGADPQHHFVYCADGTLYLLDYQTPHDIRAWTRLTRMLMQLPIQSICHPWVVFDHRDLIVTSPRSVALFQQMPDEIWCHCLRFVNARDRYSIMLTCRAFNRAGTTVFMPHAQAQKYFLLWVENGIHVDSIPFVTRVLGGQRVNALVETLFGLKPPPSDPNLKVDPARLPLTSLNGDALARVTTSSELTKANLRRLLSTTRLTVLADRTVFVEALWRQRPITAIAGDIAGALAASRSLDDTLPTLRTANHPVYAAWTRIGNIRTRVIAASVKYDQFQTLMEFYVPNAQSYGEMVYNIIVANKRFSVLLFLLERNAIPRYLLEKYAQWVCRFPREAMYVLPALRDHYPAEFTEMRFGLSTVVADRAKKQVEEPRKLRHTQLLSLFT